MPSRPSGFALLRLPDHLSVLGRRRGTVIVAVVVVAAVAVGWALLQTPKYRATASVLIKPADTTNPLDPGAAVNDPTKRLQTEADVITSQPVKQAVRARLGTAPPVSAAAHGGAEVIDISAVSTDAARAAIIANAYATAFVNYSQSQELNAALAAEAQIQSRISDLENQIDGLNAEIRAAGSNQANVSATVGAQLTPLTEQRDAFRQQLRQVQVQAAAGSGEGQLVSPAVVPNTAVSPRPVRDGIVAVLAGLLLGVGAAFAREHFDDAVTSRDDLDRMLPGRRSVGLLPHVPGTIRNRATLVTVSDPASASASAYRALATSLPFSATERPLRIVLVTSPSAGEGKTTVVANLGVALAQTGRRVIVTGCDLRRPRLQEFFGLGNAAGFTSVLRGERSVFSALQDVPGQPNLRLLASGPLPSNPSALLSTARTAEVLATLQAETDVVLLDSPPVLAASDAAVLSRLVDATVLVVAARSTTRKKIRHTLEVLAGVDAVVLATVLNHASPDACRPFSVPAGATGDTP